MVTCICNPSPRDLEEEDGEFEARLINIARLSQKRKTAWHWWLTPVIPATQEAEIRRIMVQSQARQIIPRDPISKIPNIKKGLVEWLNRP
jgi:hypothetical protein